jgi:hypothetical protein
MTDRPGPNMCEAQGSMWGLKAASHELDKTNTNNFIAELISWKHYVQSSYLVRLDLEPGPRIKIITFLWNIYEIKKIKLAFLKGGNLL